MKKVMVIGISPGVGKSTFAHKLGKKIGINVYHLDSYFWKSGWVEATYEEFAASHEEILQNDSWIIDGNYTKTFELRAKQADTIIYLELPRYLCLYRVFRRYFTHIGKKRPDLGCTERMEWEFIKFIWTTYKPRLQKMQERLERLSKEKTVIILRGKREINDFISKL
ncbi:topology modulation protein [Bacillus sinesaloumensis]|uniref:topology modulation protein n=1 Tax=Litchfieldia sinesaloumensis TaxID=1926280 RepID=UPI0009888B7B|nr:topology modulation protein [Bacillus sinesaloumensis]